MIRRVGSRVGGLALVALASGAALMATAPAQQVFRSGVDLVAVDVQVVDGSGAPIEQLGPEAFTVAINGRPRRVASVNFVRHAPSDPGPAATPVAGAPGLSPVPGRTIILAYDNGTFEVGTEGPPLDAMRRFLAAVGEDDRVGLWIFPRGEWIPPTIQRAPLRVALSQIVGGKQPLRGSYHLRPWEIVDITTESTNPNSFLALSRGQAPSDFAAANDPVLRIQQRECPGDPDCPIRIYQEGMGLAAQLEQEVQESLGGIDLLLRRLAEIPGRKCVVLVSAGVLVSDRLEGRPDVGRMGALMGQAAARANATVYTIHFDQISPSTQGTGSQRGYGSTVGSTRDRALLGHWLDEFSAGAGGQRLYVPTGQGDYAFDRVLRESSAYYLLGVEPTDADRDGRPRELKVRVDRKGASVRSRQWVVIAARKS